MNRKTMYSCALVALALSIGATEVMAQQTRSQQRIRVTKEQSTGDVTTPTPTPTVNTDSIAAAERARQDSIAAAARERARLDSIAAAERARQDSIAAAERARLDSIARADSAARAYAEWLRLRQIGGFYWGFGAGVAAPTTFIDVAHKKSLSANLLMGWDPVGSPLGLRFDLGYGSFRDRDTYFATDDGNDPQVLSASADLKLRLPAVSRFQRRFNLYGVGGGTYFRFRDMTVDDPATTGSTTVGSSWSDKFGWNAGGGLSFGWGRTNLFGEARYMKFNVDNGLNAGHMNYTVGLTWF